MMKRVLSMLMAVLMTFSLVGITTFAAELPVSKSADIDTIRSESQLIAINAPARFGYDYDWKIVQETPLYGLSNEIVAYCFDMVAVDNSQKGVRTSYAIVNANVAGFPLLLFGIDGVSAYYNVKCDKAYYLGMMDYYVEIGNSVVQPQTRETFDTAYFQAQLSTMKTESESDSDASYYSDSRITDCSALRETYINGTVVLRNSPENDNISNHGYTGVTLQWRKGCAPTAIAMLIKTHYSTLDSNTLIDDLAGYMGTGDSGATDSTNMKSGVKAYFKAYNNLTMPSTYGWNSKYAFSGAPKTGLSNNSKASYKSSIQSGFPVGVYCEGTIVVTPGYPAGSITSHMMAGMGYSFSSSGDYITCYTTNVADGLVSFPLTSTGLKNHAWFWLKW